jgi:hypothetical protein
MWTLDRWKQARRVDHGSINILGLKFHPRFRDPAGRPNLKIFDPFVNAFHQANNNWDKVAALGDIVGTAHQFINAFVPQPNPGGQNIRYKTPVDDLLVEARNALNIICGLPMSMGREANIVSMTNNVPVAIRTITANVIYLAAVGAVPNLVNIDPVIDGHILTANGLPAFTSAGLRIVRQNAVTHVVTDFNNEPILIQGGANDGLFDESRLPIYRLVGYLNTQVLPGRVDVVYHEGFADQDVQGFTARMSGLYAGRTPSARPVVIVRMTPCPGGNLTHPTTLAHEMGHAVTDCGQHSTQPNDLMASGAIRGGVNSLSAGEKAWFRNNPYAL